MSALDYSFFKLCAQAFGGHRDWLPAWRTPEPKSSYDVVIVGGGGHGLAAAYYLAKVHGIVNVAVLEKGWIGGGNTGRNTTNVRSDYMFPESAALYDLSLRLFEELSQEINFNVMLSQVGWLTLIHSDHELESARHKVNWLACNAIDSEIVDRARLQRMLPHLNINQNPRYAVLGAFHQKRGGTVRHDAVAWGYARAADRLGVDIIQNCEVTGFEKRGERIEAVLTSRGRFACDRVGMAVAGHSSVVARMAGFRLPIRSHPLQALVSEPIKPFLKHVVISPRTGLYVNQSSKGELVMGGPLDLYHSYAQRGNFPTIEKVIAAAVEMFPICSQLRLMRHWAGIVDIVPDRSPILGPTPISNLYINCGWGTGGFKAIPVGGKLLAHSLATGTTHSLAAPFVLERFHENRLIDEGAAAGIAH